MIVEEAIEIVEQILDHQSLNKVQEMVFRQAWEGKSYTEIATNIGYDSEYVKQVGFELWRSLSLRLEKKVTKNNFQLILTRYALQAQILTPIPATSFNQNGLGKCDRKKNVSELENSFALTATIPSFPEHLRQDWGDAPDVSAFYGRDTELLDLEQWLKSDRCRLVTILGKDGAGKTAFCAKVAERVQKQFDSVIWRSLRNTPPIEEILTVLIEFLSHKQEINKQEINQAEGTPPLKRRSPFDLPESIDEKIYLLLNYLRFFRCLIVLDNAESILQNGELAGEYRAGYEGYGQLFRCVATTRHQSYLMLTSRQKLKWLEAKEGEQSRMRSLNLAPI
jgi:hypothetical protein